MKYDYAQFLLFKFPASPSSCLSYFSYIILFVVTVVSRQRVSRHFAFGSSTELSAASHLHSFPNSSVRFSCNPALGHTSCKPVSPQVQIHTFPGKLICTLRYTLTNVISLFRFLNFLQIKTTSILAFAHLPCYHLTFCQISLS